MKQKEKLIPYLLNKVKQAKNYSGEKLTTRLNRIEKIISAERLNGNISDKELEILMLEGYLEASKKVIEEYVDRVGMDSIHANQAITSKDFPGQKEIKPDSEYGKMCNKFFGLVEVVRSNNQNNNS